MKINLKKGDIILGGKFRNKPYEFESWDKDEHGQPVIVTSTGKKLKLLNLRIKKLMKETRSNRKNSWYRSWRSTLAREAYRQYIYAQKKLGAKVEPFEKWYESWKKNEEFDNWTCMRCYFQSPKRFRSCPKCRSGEVENLGEGFNKPGGRHIGVSGEELKKVTCKKCNGTGSKGLTKDVPCDQCKGKGFYKIDPGLKQSEEGLNIGGLDKPVNMPEMSTVAGVAGFNAPLGSGYKTNKRGVKKNFKINEMARPNKIVADAIKKALELYDKPNNIFDKETSWQGRDWTGKNTFEKIADFVAFGTGEDVAYVKMFLKKPFRDLVALHNSQWALNPNSDRYKEMEETKSFKRIIKEIDLSLISGTLSNWVSQVSQTGELGKQFGANYKPADFEKWLRSEIEKNDLKISDKYVAKLMSRLKGHPKHDQFVVYNAFLSGAGLGLTERKKH